MSLRSRLQDRPLLLVHSWRATERLLRLLSRRFDRLGIERASRMVEPIEKPLKRLLFDCRMCGQCVLHYTGMTCPMTCPKEIRNGPCGGVRLDGSCEVEPERPCIWVQVLERLPRTPWSHEQLRLNPPVDWRLEGLASWVTFAVGRDRVATGSESEPRSAAEVLE